MFFSYKDILEIQTCVVSESELKKHLATFTWKIDQQHLLTGCLLGFMVGISANPTIHDWINSENYGKWSMESDDLPIRLIVEAFLTGLSTNKH